MGGIGVSQALSPEYYPGKGGDEEYYDDVPDMTSDVNSYIPDEVLAEVEKELEEELKDYPKCMSFWMKLQKSALAAGFVRK